MDEAKPSTRTVDRALQLFERVLEARGGSTLAELSRGVELSPATASRLLATLAGHGLVTRGDDGRYAAGPRMKQLAAEALRDDPLYELAGPHLETLAEVTQEMAALGCSLGDDEVLYLRQVSPSAQLVQAGTWTGRTIPRADTAMGRALSDELTDAGYAISSREENEIDAVAAPVFGHRGTVLGVLSITAPRYRTSYEDLERFGRIVLAHAAQMSEALGADMSMLRSRGRFPGA
ncbi:IclR family transcriptional regulator [Microbacterium tumbae]